MADSYSNEGSNEYEIKEEQSQDNIDNSYQTDIKKEKIELNDKDGKDKPFKYSTNQNEVCKICGLEFFSKAVLVIHHSLIHIHPEENKTNETKNSWRHDGPLQDRVKQYECKTSKHEIRLKSDLNRHVESFHEEIKPFRCNICDYKTAIKGHLKRHIETVHEGIKPFKCNICNYNAAQKWILKRHIESVHEGLKPI